MELEEFGNGKYTNIEELFTRKFSLYIGDSNIYFHYIQCVLYEDNNYCHNKY